MQPDKVTTEFDIGFSVVHNIIVRKIFRNTDHYWTADRKMQLLSKSIIRRFEDPRSSFFTACVVYRLELHKGIFC